MDEQLMPSEAPPSPPEPPKKWYQQITVEPTMFLYMFAFMFTSVIELAFYVQRACRTNHNYSAAICDNLTQYQDIKKEVQRTVSNFHQWNSIAGHVVPIVLALFLGSWSDRRGRKLPLLLGLFGKIIFSSAMVLNTMNDSWPVEYVIYTASIPGALTGSDVVIFASCFSYISDVSTVKDRTIRVTILDVCYLISMPIGVALGAVVFNAVNQSYTIMFAINAAFLVLAFIYSCLNLKWLTTEKQRSITEVDCGGLLTDFFNREHVIESLKTMTRPRTNHRRMYLWLFMFAMFFYTFQRDEKPMTFLYTQLKFHWDTQTYSNFKTFQTSAYIIMMLCGIPIMNKLFHWKDTTIAIIGTISHTIARIFFATAQVPWVFYVGGFWSSIGPIAGPVLRSMVSKVVPMAERGKVFALFSVCDNAVPFVSGVLYSQIYNLTIGKFPGIFVLTAVTQIIVFCLMMTVHWYSKGESLNFVEKEMEKSDSNSTVITVAAETEKGESSAKI